MKIFVKRNHFDKFSPIGVYIILCILTVVSWKCNAISFLSGIAWIFFTLILTLLLCRYLGTLGLYISDDKVYYKTFRRRQIDVQEIAAIRITKSVATTNSNTTFHPNIEWKDIRGKQLYSMIFYHEYRPHSMHETDLGDRFFLDTFLDAVLFRTVYDSSALNYIKSVNPEVIIILPSGQIADK